ncbi:MAG: hypothetical protein J5958_01410 [Clostridia bacterium]|nr:hypothetical protein [Clostridia bacterium]
MSRLQRLIRVLSCRTGLRTGKSVQTNGNFPLTKQGTFGGFSLRDYGVLGASPTANPTPANPVFRKFVGEADLSDGTKGLSLVFSVTDAAGNTESTTATFPGVEPLRTAAGVSDELNFGTGKLIRRVGVCRDPVILPGMRDSFGGYYPALGLLVGDGSTIPTHQSVLATHWKEIRGRELIYGDAVGMDVQSGVLYANLPRPTYRRYVKGCVGETDEEEDGSSKTVVSSPAAGTYRCDFFDGTSRVFTLNEGMDGIPGCADVLAVSRSSAILKKSLSRHVFTGSESFTVLSDYEDTGATLFRLAKSDYGGRTDGDEELTSFCSYYTYASYMTPYEMIDESDGNPAFCEDEDYWYFYHPGKSTLTKFRNYLIGRANAGAPVTLVYPCAEPVEISLQSTLAETAAVSDVTPCADVTDNYVFNMEESLTLAPAMREFFEEERAAGRGIEIYYALPTADVTETELPLPTLTAGEGATTFSVASAQAGAEDPVSGSFTALCEE